MDLNKDSDLINGRPCSSDVIVRMIIKRFLYKLDVEYNYFATVFKLLANHTQALSIIVAIVIAIKAAGTAASSSLHLRSVGYDAHVVTNFIFTI